MYLLVFTIFVIITYLIICSNPHDYQSKYYNKLYTLSYIPKEFRFKSNYYNKDTIKLFNYPYVLKPYMCDSFSIGVKKINNVKERDLYLKTFQPEFTMIEEYTEYSNEIGISYLFKNNKYQYTSCVKRNNHQDSIINYGKTYFECIWKGIPTGINRNDLLTPELISQLNVIGYSIPGNHIGRYDIKYKSDALLKQGKSFVVLEVNGGIGLDLIITTVSIYNVYDRCLYMYKWVKDRVIVGFYNISYINHERCANMYFQYGMLILYYHILQLRLLVKC